MLNLSKRIGNIKKFFSKNDIEQKYNSPKFKNSHQYWNDRYNAELSSGNGSYDKFAEFKAKILNEFIEKNKIDSAIEYGCGDGNQLGYINYNQYIGYDISDKAVAECKKKYKNDKKKEFKLLSEYSGAMADLTVSLDVIYHLIENDVFDKYMYRLFDSSRHYVVIYSSNTNANNDKQASHVKNRKFTDWVEINKPNWVLHDQIPNKYPYTGDPKTGSRSDFFIFRKQ